MVFQMNIVASPSWFSMFVIEWWLLENAFSEVDEMSFLYLKLVNKAAKAVCNGQNFDNGRVIEG